MPSGRGILQIARTVKGPQLSKSNLILFDHGITPDFVGTKLGLHKIEKQCKVHPSCVIFDFLFVFNYIFPVMKQNSKWAFKLERFFEVGRYGWIVSYELAESFDEVRRTDLKIGTLKGIFLCKLFPGDESIGVVLVELVRLEAVFDDDLLLAIFVSLLAYPDLTFSSRLRRLDDANIISVITCHDRVAVENEEQDMVRYWGAATLGC
jgi:hypothetical protein